MSLTPEQQARLEQAQQDEAQALTEATIAYLRGRVVTLNVEIRTRDARIAELEAAAAGSGGPA